MKSKVVFAIPFFVVGLLFYFDSYVHAADSMVSTSVAIPPSSPLPSPRPTPKPGTFVGIPGGVGLNVSSISGNLRVKGIDKLNSLRLNACQAHEQEITTRSQSLGSLVSTILSTFDSIATRVENFYTNKVVSGGKSVTNYSALVADIAAKRTAVETDLTNTQSDVAGFTCTGDNPKGQITQYRIDMQKVKADLQAYRTSIKNLIVAIRTVAGSATPTPVASPKPVPAATTIY